ncbi:MAG: hypothetical protein ACKVWR_03670 [Acidimicrobiales bacterium]
MKPQLPRRLALQAALAALLLVLHESPLAVVALGGALALNGVLLLRQLGGRPAPRPRPGQLDPDQGGLDDELVSA